MALDFWPEPVSPDDVGGWAEDQLRRLGGMLDAARPVWVDATYKTNWADGNAPTWVGAQYCRDGMGFVHVRGLVRRINSLMSGASIILTLPEGYRPAKREVFPQLSIDGASQVDVLANGDLAIITPNLDVDDWLTLGAITFYAGVRGE